jgi:hypothetical protein
VIAVKTLTDRDKVKEARRAAGVWTERTAAPEPGDGSLAKDSPPSR